MPLDDAESRWGGPYLVIHRADLQRALVEALYGQPSVELSLGTTVLDFANDRGRLSVELTTGLTQARDDADLLIGADGLRSQVRDRLGFGAQDQAEFTGRVAYRAIINADDADTHLTRNNIILRLGREAHLVQYGLRHGSIINLVATIRSAAPTGSADHERDGASTRSILERAFTGWSKEARLLAKAPVQWRAWPLYHRPPISFISRSGASRLSATRLTRWSRFLRRAPLKQSRTPARSPASLLERRISRPLSRCTRAIALARAGRVQREALKLGRIYHMSGPLAFARDATMRLLGTRGLIERYDWLYGA